jgi:hypothetical protein
VYVCCCLKGCVFVPCSEFVYVCVLLFEGLCDYATYSPQMCMWAVVCKALCCCCVLFVPCSEFVYVCVLLFAGLWDYATYGPQMQCGLLFVRLCAAAVCLCHAQSCIVFKCVHV